MNVDNEYLVKYCKTKIGIMMCKQTQAVHDRKNRHDCASELINFGNTIELCKFVEYKIEEITFIPLELENQYVVIPREPIDV